MGLAPGTRFGAYRVAGSIGAGGMGEVYRATDTTLERDVAIKILPESFASDADRVARFEQEAKTLASLNHANIAQIYGLEKADGTTGIVMELVEGPTLADRIGESPVPPEEALNIAMQIADALEAAHARGIVHRDLKPANIKLRPDGIVKVLDFGIAKALYPRSPTSGPQSPVLTTPATQAGVILGTAAYMSPEQARGMPVNQRTDIWAFGCVLFEMLTGQPAFAGDDVAVTLARVITHSANTDSLPGAISPAVRHTIQLCLEKDARNRIADISDVRLGLEGRLESGLRSETSAAGRAPARMRIQLAAVGVAAALLAGALVWASMRPGPQPAPTVSRFLITPPATAPLASFGGYDLAISPDGRRIAYYAQRDEERGGVDLYLRDIGELEARVLPGTNLPSDTGGAPNPFFAADGTWVGFNSTNQGVLRAAISGGPPVKMADNIDTFLGGTAAADGSLIYSSGDGLYRVSTGGGGTPVRLTGEPASGQSPYIAPQLLPGGRAVLFCYGNERVAVLDLATGEETVLVEGGQNALYAATGHIVFARGTTLMAVPFDLDRLAVTGEPVALVQGVRNPPGNTAADYAMSATGTLAYVLDRDESTTGELVWVDRNGQIVERAIGEQIDTPSSPRLSPDGRRLALSTGVRSELDLWIYDLGGRPPIPIAVDGDNVSAAWSPDGMQIAFSSNRTGGVTGYELYTSPADGSVLDPKPLRGDRLDLSPAVWTAENELIVVRCCGGEDLFVARAEPAAELRELVVTESNEFDPALSPNGRWLAFATNRTGQNEIWVKGYPDGVPARVSNGGGVEPRWSHDGRELYYRRGTAVMAVAVETEAEFSFDAAVELFDEPYFANPDPYVNSYDVAGDGRFLMIEPSASAADTQGSASIVVVQNWFTELERLVPTE